MLCANKAKPQNVDENKQTKNTISKPASTNTAVNWSKTLKAPMNLKILNDAKKITNASTAKVSSYKYANRCKLTYAPAPSSEYKATRFSDANIYMYALDTTDAKNNERTKIW